MVLVNSHGGVVTPSNVNTLQLGGVPEREGLFVNHTHAQKLHDQLELAQPGELKDAPAVLNFDRARRIDIPWKSIIEASDIGEAVMASSRSLREYFELSWWGADAEDLDDKLKILATQKEQLVFLRPPEVETDPQPDPAPETPPAEEPAVPKALRFYRTNPASNAKEGTEVTEGLFFRHGRSGRLYYMILAGETPETPDEFLSSKTKYDAFWKDQVISIEPVFSNAGEAQKYCTSYSELDVRAPFIVQRYQELVALKVIADKVKKFAEDTIDQTLAATVGPSFDLEGLEDLQVRYRNISLAPSQLNNDFKRLKHQAEEMGYVLFHDGDTAEPFPDGQKPDVKAGNLYQINTREYKWIPIHDKPTLKIVGDAISYGLRWVFGGARGEKFQTTYEGEEENEPDVKHYDLVDTTIDLLTKRLLELRAEGKQAFVFEESSRGFVTVNGEPIGTIMDRCGYDEAFRRTCVVLIPEYDRSLTGRKVVARYHIYRHPLPGIVPTRLPSLAVRESLSFRTVWKSVELGELASTINLAPGEEREISITRSFQRETTSAETRNSVFELASSESSDLAEEMERVTSAENEFKSHAKSTSEVESTQNTKAEAGTGKASPYKVSASSSLDNRLKSTFEWGADNSLKLFNKSISKVARKAARSINRNSRQEVSSASTEKTTISNAETTTIKISNINQGRTLNLMFYHVFNRFSAGLYLDDIMLEVSSGVELIAGSGIYHSASYNLNQIDNVLNELTRTPLPLEMDDIGRARYELDVLNTLDWLIAKEYEGRDEDGASADQSDLLTGGNTAETAATGARPADLEPLPQSTFSSIARVTFERSAPDSQALTEAPVDSGPARTSARKRKSGTDPVEMLRRRREALSKTYDSIQIHDLSLADTSLLVASPGLYLDAIIGVRASTEPYSEEMRKQEIRMRAAEVDEAQARTRYQLAQATRVARIGVDQMMTGSNMIIGVLPDEEFRSLSLRLKFPLGPGKWTLCVDAVPISGGKIPSTMTERVSLQLDWGDAGGQDWMRDDNLIQRISLLNADTEETIE